MDNPILNRTVVVPIDAAGVRLDVLGRHVKIVSCTVATILMGFDQSTPERVYPDDCYAGPTAGFKSLRFVADVGACTVVIQVSAEPIVGGSTGLAVLHADLEKLKPGTSKTGTRSAAITQTGAGATSILATNLDRKSGFVQGDIDNAGRVWLGLTNAVTQANSWFELLPGATCPELKDTLAVWACSENGTERVRYYETE